MSKPKTLQSILDSIGNPAVCLRTAKTGSYPFPFPAEYSNWRDEQAGWKSAAVMFDQSFHMTDVYFRGPGVQKLLADFSVNSFATFGPGKAKQVVTVNEQGKLIADAILFGWEQDVVSVVGSSVAGNWLRYQAERGKYDVEVEVDASSVTNPHRKLFRFQLNGPATQPIVEKASGGSFKPIKFFNIGRFVIEGVEVQALNHAMSRVPGRDDTTGLEITGPISEGPRIRAALQSAGEQFGLLEGGSLSYGSSALEGSWIPLPVPAIYTGESMRGYREWLPAQSLEANFSIAGSFASDNIEDYYVTPWDMGYGRTIKFDHDFYGRDALERMADQPHRRKVWLIWNDEDVARAIVSSYFGGDKRAKYLAAPYASYGISQYDTLQDNGRFVGFSTILGYTVNIGSWSSLAIIDEDVAIDGKELTLIWGETGVGLTKPTVESHVQTEIRATVRTAPIV